MQTDSDSGSPFATFSSSSPSTAPPPLPAAPLDPASIPLPPSPAPTAVGADPKSTSSFLLFSPPSDSSGTPDNTSRAADDEKQNTTFTTTTSTPAVVDLSEAELVEQLACIASEIRSQTDKDPRHTTPTPTKYRAAALESSSEPVLGSSLPVSTPEEDEPAIVAADQSERVVEPGAESHRPSTPPVIPRGIAFPVKPTSPSALASTSASKSAAAAPSTPTRVSPRPPSVVRRLRPRPRSLAEEIADVGETVPKPELDLDDDINWAAALDVTTTDIQRFIARTNEGGYDRQRCTFPPPRTCAKAGTASGNPRFPSRTPSFLRPTFPFTPPVIGAHVWRHSIAGDGLGLDTGLNHQNTSASSLSPRRSNSIAGIAFGPFRIRRKSVENHLTIVVPPPTSSDDLPSPVSELPYEADLVPTPTRASTATTNASTHSSERTSSSAGSPFKNLKKPRKSINQMFNKKSNGNGHVMTNVQTSQELDDNGDLIETVVSTTRRPASIISTSRRSNHGSRTPSVYSIPSPPTPTTPIARGDYVANVVPTQYVTNTPPHRSSSVRSGHSSHHSHYSHHHHDSPTQSERELPMRDHRDRDYARSERSYRSDYDDRPPVPPKRDHGDHRVHRDHSLRKLKPIMMIDYSGNVPTYVPYQPPYASNYPVPYPQQRQYSQQQYEPPIAMGVPLSSPGSGGTTPLFVNGPQPIMYAPVPRAAVASPPIVPPAPAATAAPKAAATVAPPKPPSPTPSVHITVNATPEAASPAPAPKEEVIKVGNTEIKVTESAPPVAPARKAAEQTIKVGNAEITVKDNSPAPSFAKEDVVKIGNISVKVNDATPTPKAETVKLGNTTITVQEAPSVAVEPATPPPKVETVKLAGGGKITITEERATPRVEKIKLADGGSIEIKPAEKAAPIRSAQTISVGDQKITIADAAPETPNEKFTLASGATLEIKEPKPVSASATETIHLANGGTLEIKDPPEKTPKPGVLTLNSADTVSINPATGAVTIRQVINPGVDGLRPGSPTGSVRSTRSHRPHRSTGVKDKHDHKSTKSGSSHEKKRRDGSPTPSVASHHSHKSVDVKIKESPGGSREIHAHIHKDHSDSEDENDNKTKTKKDGKKDDKKDKKGKHDHLDDHHHHHKSKDDKKEKHKDSKDDTPRKRKVLNTMGSDSDSGDEYEVAGVTVKVPSLDKDKDAKADAIAEKDKALAGLEAEKAKVKALQEKEKRRKARDALRRAGPRMLSSDSEDSLSLGSPTRGTTLDPADRVRGQRGAFPMGQSLGMGLGVPAPHHHLRLPSEIDDYLYAAPPPMMPGVGPAAPWGGVPLMSMPVPLSNWPRPAPNPALRPLYLGGGTFGPPVSSGMMPGLGYAAGQLGHGYLGMTSGPAPMMLSRPGFPGQPGWYPRPPSY